ncbi:MAG TPA: putative nucleotidyltransferase substrate binding domain-containing protein [Vicinamibacterales bacterium]|jgi:CBS domain-containing protein|nr:putative nucleotidyltransferase substrate binding domain-containing protein [Vicinamibacterales bacterium]
MDTSTISYRVADFLKQYPPFHSMDDVDVLAVAGRGRVRFHERNEHILSEGETHKHEVFVIQQGVVSLWSEINGAFELRDVRGPGDLLGVERFNGASSTLHSARAATDVVIYALPAGDIETLLEKYPDARRFVAAYSTVTLDYQAAEARRRPEDIFLYDVAKAKPIVTCDCQESIRDVARAMRAHGVDAIVVRDSNRRPCGLITAIDLLTRLTDGNGSSDQPVASVLQPALVALSPTASVADGILAMGPAASPALVITADGTPDGELHALVTAADIASVFGDQPVAILHEVRRASGTPELRALNHRARAFALQYLESAHSVDWLARFTALVDDAIVTRVIALADNPDSDGWCWALCGSSGRGETLPRLAPELLLIADNARPGLAGEYQRVADLLLECDYRPRTNVSFERSFYAASIGEWKSRYEAWVRSPILEQMYLARSLFDLRPLLDPHPFCRDIEATVASAIDRDFLRIIANDCVARLPPLTIFQDAVVDDMGERSAMFQLDRNALTPLVDVARVYGMAAGRVLAGSTRDRFATARRLLPQHDAIFREAADTCSVVLWLQARVGIRQGTDGAELPPALLSRHDRQVLKSGFRVIHRLIELTSNYAWLDAL